MTTLFATNVFAEPATVCTEYEARKAEAVAGKARGWDQVFKNYTLYRHCDDGAIGEGFSESVTLLLSESWTEIDRLKKLTQKDGDFEPFVLSHIDESVPEERLERIVMLATNSCPRTFTTLCEKILETLRQDE